MAKKLIIKKSYQTGGVKKAFDPALAIGDIGFQNWYKKNTLEGQAGKAYNDKQAYDYYSFYANKDHLNPGFSIEQHFPDTYKRPSHPTFSDESIYSTPENPGGSWKGEKYIPMKKKLVLAKTYRHGGKKVAESKFIERSTNPLVSAGFQQGGLASTAGKLTPQVNINPKSLAANLPKPVPTSVPASAPILDWTDNPDSGWNTTYQNFEKGIVQYAKHKPERGTFTRKDYDQFKSYEGLPNEHPVNNLMVGHRKKLLAEFESKPNVAAVDYITYDLEGVPSEMQWGKGAGKMGAPGTQFDFNRVATLRNPPPPVVDSTQAPVVAPVQKPPAVIPAQKPWGYTTDRNADPTQFDKGFTTPGKKGAGAYDRYSKKHRKEMGYQVGGDYTDMNTTSAQHMQANTYPATKKKNKHAVSLTPSFQAGGAFQWGANAPGGGGANTGAMFGAAGNAAASIVDTIDPGNEYGVKSTAGAIGSEALKMGAAGAAFGPVGAGIGLAAGVALGAFKNSKAKQAQKKAEAAIAKTQSMKSQNESITALANFENQGTGITSFKDGGMQKKSLLVSAPGGFGNDGKYHFNNLTFFKPGNFENGGFQQDTGMGVSNGNMKQISKDAYEVQGDNPDATDDVAMGDAFVDHGEVVKPQADGARIYSDNLKPIGSKQTFAQIAKKLEKSKSLKGKPNPVQDAHVETKLKSLFFHQQKLNGDSQGETTEEAIQPAGETPGQGMSQGNMFKFGGLSPVNKSYHDITPARIGIKAKEAMATNVISKKYYNAGGEAKKFYVTGGEETGPYDPYAKGMPTGAELLQNMATNQGRPSPRQRVADNMGYDNAAAATPADLGLAGTKLRSSAVGQITPGVNIDPKALAASLPGTVPASAGNVKVKTKTPFDWNTAAGMVGSLGSNFANAALIARTPQVADVAMTKTPVLKKLDFSDQQAMLKEGLRASLKSGERNSTMQQAREGSQAASLGEYSRAVNQMQGDANRANIGIANQQAEMGWRNDASNNQILNRYKQDQQARSSSILSAHSANIADFGNKIQGFAAQNNAMKLDQKKLDMQRSYYDKIAPGLYGRNQQAFGASEAEFKKWQESQAGSEYKTGGLILRRLPKPDAKKPIPSKTVIAVKPPSDGNQLLLDSYNKPKTKAYRSGGMVKRKLRKAC